jgi:hypothetical protein
MLFVRILCCYFDLEKVLLLLKYYSCSDTPDLFFFWVQLTPFKFLYHLTPYSGFSLFFCWHGQWCNVIVKFTLNPPATENLTGFLLQPPTSNLLCLSFTPSPHNSSVPSSSPHIQESKVPFPMSAKRATTNQLPWK